MNTSPLTLEDKRKIMADVDAAMDKYEPDYVEWCSDGNDPTDHIWYLLAAAVEMLEELEGEQA